jgi:hypothetical protein
MGLEKIRRRLAVRGNVSIGANADATLTRLGANVIGPATGDTLGLNTGTAAIGTADILVNGGMLLRQQAAGSPCLAFRNSSGTIYSLHFAAAGGAVTGTPVT